MNMFSIGCHPNVLIRHNVLLMKNTALTVTPLLLIISFVSSFPAVFTSHRTIVHPSFANCKRSKIINLWRPVKPPSPSTSRFHCQLQLSGRFHLQFHFFILLIQVEQQLNRRKEDCTFHTLPGQPFHRQECLDRTYDKGNENPDGRPRRMQNFLHVFHDWKDWR